MHTKDTEANTAFEHGFWVGAVIALLLIGILI